ncbi:MAG: hypothetical protein EXS37_14250 [Opitutus sp.]|nr:hypothetical protein [Opitutus sp.]
MWLVLVCAALLVLRKPWALHTPQLWAEDGSIFLTQDEQMGLRAFFEPYNGYLHLLPRLIAWLASHTADPAWWPAIYNGLAFAISVGLFARMASPRVELPSKSWLMLAFVLVVGTGEVLINVTNLQWVTAFFLLLQIFLARPTTAAQRFGDIAILLIVGLNGPFAIVFLPLLAWRTWRERHADNFLALAALGACAVVQGWLVTHTGGGLSLHEGAEPFRPLMGLSILGSRLVTWTFLGPAPVRAWPLWVHAVIAVAFIGALLAWALRADARRAVRGPLVAAFCLVTVACAYRVRADTWQDDNLVNGDRYFYISRVLLAWLLILEIDTVPRTVAYAARVLCLAGVLTHAPRFILPAPPDYKWAAHCDPIRRGVPANIYTLPEGWWIEYPGRPAKK